MRDRQHLDLADLLDACAQRDRHAFRALFDAEAGRMMAIAYRILYRRDLAEDAVQEAFIQIWKNAHRSDWHLSTSETPTKREVLIALCPRHVRAKRQETGRTRTA